jgi:hypothetical protein
VPDMAQSAEDIGEMCIAVYSVEVAGSGGPRGCREDLRERAGRVAGWHGSSPAVPKDE